MKAPHAVVTSLLEVTTAGSLAASSSAAQDDEMSKPLRRVTGFTADKSMAPRLLSA